MRARKRAEERQDEIVLAAVRLAETVGPERLTTGAIAAAIGITQAAVFRHFPRKQDIWDAVAVHIAERMDAAWEAAGEEAAARDGGPADRIRNLVLGQLALVQSTPAIPAILFSRELHVDNATLRAAFLGLIRRFVARLVANVEAGIADGSLRPDLDPRDAAFLAVAMMQGLIVRWSLSERGFDLRAEGERLLAVLLRGFTAPAPAVGGTR